MKTAQFYVLFGLLPRESDRERVRDSLLKNRVSGTSVPDCTTQKLYTSLVIFCTVLYCSALEKSSFRRLVKVKQIKHTGYSGTESGLAGGTSELKGACGTNK